MGPMDPLLPLLPAPLAPAAHGSAGPMGPMDALLPLLPAPLAQAAHGPTPLARTPVGAPVQCCWRWAAGGPPKIGGEWQPKVRHHPPGDCLRAERGGPRLCAAWTGAEARLPPREPPRVSRASTSDTRSDTSTALPLLKAATRLDPLKWQLPNRSGHPRALAVLALGLRRMCAHGRGHPRPWAPEAPGHPRFFWHATGKLSMYRELQN